MVVNNQNIAAPYIYSNFALVREVGLLIIIPSFSESSFSEVAQQETKLLTTCLAVKNIRLKDTVVVTRLSLYCPLRSSLGSEEHEYIAHGMWIMAEISSLRYRSFYCRFKS